MASQAEDELTPSQTDGFKVSEKKTIDEYTKLDAEDESLAKWKASLGISSGPTASDPSDPRRCIIQSLTLEVKGRSNIAIDLTAPGSLEQLKGKPFTIKEGAEFNMKAVFKVQHDVLSGLKYVQSVKRKGIQVAKDEEMLGSFPPNTLDKPTYEKRFYEKEAPSGMISRGHYNAKTQFIDDDNVTHLKFEWSFDIAKDW